MYVLKAKIKDSLVHPGWMEVCLPSSISLDRLNCNNRQTFIAFTILQPKLNLWKICWMETKRQTMYMGIMKYIPKFSLNWNMHL